MNILSVQKYYTLYFYMKSKHNNIYNTVTNSLKGFFLKYSVISRKCLNTLKSSFYTEMLNVVRYSVPDEFNHKVLAVE